MIARCLMITSTEYQSKTGSFKWNFLLFSFPTLRRLWTGQILTSSLTSLMTQDFRYHIGTDTKDMYVNMWPGVGTWALLSHPSDFNPIHPFSGLFSPKLQTPWFFLPLNAHLTYWWPNLPPPELWPVQCITGLIYHMTMKFNEHTALNI